MADQETPVENEIDDGWFIISGEDLLEAQENVCNESRDAKDENSAVCEDGGGGGEAAEILENDSQSADQSQPVQEPENEISINDTNDALEISPECLECDDIEKLPELPPPQEEADDVRSIPSSSSSDIDILDDRQDDDFASPSGSSSISHLSEFSFLGTSASEYSLHAQESAEVLQEDTSDISSPSQEGQISPGVHSYAHYRHPTDMFILDICVGVIFATLMGLIVGHFFGHLHQSENQMLLSTHQVSQLRQLQDELIHCLDEQNAMLALKDGGKKSMVCYKNSDHWKRKFEQLFEEHHSLKEFLEKSQLQFAEGPLSETEVSENMKCHCSEEASTEFRKLKLDFLVKQVEHLQLLKTCEKVKTKERKSQEKLKKLEEENNQLKTKLSEENEKTKQITEEKLLRLEEENNQLKSKIDDHNHDSYAREHLQAKIMALKHENSELTKTLQDLQKQEGLPVQPDSVDEDSVEVSEAEASTKQPKQDLDMLLEKVHKITLDNEELKKSISKIQQHKEAVNNDVNDVAKEKSLENAEQEKPQKLVQSLQEQLQILMKILELEKNETKKWKLRYRGLEKMLENKNYGVFSLINWTAISSGDYIKESGIAKVAQSVLEYISAHKENISQEMHNHLQATISMFLSTYNSVIETWIEVENSSEEQTPRIKKSANKVWNTLFNVYKKFEQAGEKLVTSQKPLTDGMAKFMGKTLELVDGLGKKLTEVQDKLAKQFMKPEKAPKMKPEAMPEESSTGSTDPNVDLEPNWYLKRADARRQHLMFIEEEPGILWLFERAKERERYRNSMPQSSQHYESWYVRRGKSRENYRKNYKSEDIIPNEDLPPNVKKAAHNVLGNCCRKQKSKNCKHKRQEEIIDKENVPVMENMSL